MHLTLINANTPVKGVQILLRERYGVEAPIYDVEDCFISLIADNEKENMENYYRYLEMKT